MTNSDLSQRARSLTSDQLQSLIRKLGHRGDAYDIEHCQMMGFDLRFSPSELLQLGNAAILEAGLQEALKEKEAWKVEALQSLEKWHKLGDVLLTYYPFHLHLGDDIPAMLTALLENDSILNNTLDALHETGQRLEQAEAALTSAQAEIARLKEQLAEIESAARAVKRGT